MQYSDEQVSRAKSTDLVLFLKSQGEKLIKSGKEYRWMAHDSVTVCGNCWFRHSRGTGGGPIDFVMEFYGLSFPEAMKKLTGEDGKGRREAKDAPYQGIPAPAPDFRLPKRNRDEKMVMDYLAETRGLDKELVQHFLSTGDIYEDEKHHNVVFVGKDLSGIPRYAHCRGTGRELFRGDVSGSAKEFGFCHRGSGKNLYVFEAPIDLLSFIQLFPKDWERENYLSLGGTSDRALAMFLSDSPQITAVFLCLDNDKAGNEACEKLVLSAGKCEQVIRLKPARKDWNEVLCHLADTENYNPVAETVVLKIAEEAVPMICYRDVEQTSVDWLWFPYIPFGKLTIIQGNPGEGKTYFAMKLTAACTNRKYLPNMEAMEPFNVIYQTAEDGTGDTIKPRLVECETDLSRVLIIDDTEIPLTLSDDRIGKAIRQNKVRLLIIDPVQAFIGADVDMNRANEVRPVFRKLGRIAEETGCAIVLIGHLNKASGTQSTYRGLGSIDIMAAVRSLLFIGKVKKDPTTRVLIHEKSSLAPPGETLAFKLGDEGGFRWIGGYDINADDLLNGKEGKQIETKLERGTRMMEEMLKGGKEIPLKDIQEQAALMNISSRTMRDVRSRMGERLIYGKGEGRENTVRLKTD